MAQESKDNDLDLPALADTSLDSAASFRNVNSNVSSFTIQMESILAIFLNQTANSPIRSALAENHIFDAYDLVGLTHQEINTLMYNDINGNKQPLTLGQLKLLKYFRDFVIYRNRHGEQTIQNYADIDPDEFSQFKIDYADLLPQLNAPLPSPPNNNTSTNAIARIVSPKSAF